jgi:hypothetical protein
MSSVETRKKNLPNTFEVHVKSFYSSFLSMESLADGRSDLDVVMPRVHTAFPECQTNRKSRGAELRSDSTSPQGLKHRLSQLEKTVHGQVFMYLFYTYLSLGGGASVAEK